jgi:hypothetical protein
MRVSRACWLALLLASAVAGDLTNGVAAQLAPPNSPEGGGKELDFENARPLPLPVVKVPRQRLRWTGSPSGSAVSAGHTYGYAGDGAKPAR